VARAFSAAPNVPNFKAVIAVPVLKSTGYSGGRRHLVLGDPCEKQSDNRVWASQCGGKADFSYARQASHQ
jgi:hypothetical protein